MWGPLNDGHVGRVGQVVEAPLRIVGEDVEMGDRMALTHFVHGPREVMHRARGDHHGKVEVITPPHMNGRDVRMG